MFLLGFLICTPVSGHTMNFPPFFLKKTQICTAPPIVCGRRKLAHEPRFVLAFFGGYERAIPWQLTNRGAPCPHALGGYCGGPSQSRLHMWESEAPNGLPSTVCSESDSLCESRGFGRLLLKTCEMGLGATYRGRKTGGFRGRPPCHEILCRKHIHTHNGLLRDVWCCNF